MFSSRKHVLVIITIVIVAVVDSLSTVEVEDFRRDMLNLHNNERYKYGLPPLIRDNYLEAISWNWVLKTGEEKFLRHSRRKGVGENIGYLIKNHTNYFEAENVVFSLWIDETHNELDHWSQVNWKDTQKLGCSIYNYGPVYYIVCNYLPPGNIIGSKPF